MGMDVVGRNPENKTGEYFRNNIWWWSPLWEYCLEVAPEICNQVENGFSNDGDGLDHQDSVELSKRLFATLTDGSAKKHIDKRKKYIKSLPDLPCVHCKATGTRTWYHNEATGQDRSAYSYPLFSQDENELPKYTDKEIEQGETEFTQVCNGCGGKGTTKPYAASYGINLTNIRNFAKFLKSSGGFQIF